MTASTPAPIASVYGLVLPSWLASTPRRSSIMPCGASRPSTPGNCEITMCAAMPARKPVVTGIDRRSAIQPSRKTPAATSSRPTIRRERRGKHEVVGRAGGRRHRDAAGEDRRDGRVGAAGEESAAAERREGERGGDQHEQPDLRREIAEPRGRHLLGDGDRRQGEAGDQVAGQEFEPVAGERAKQRPRAPAQIGLARPARVSPPVPAVSARAVASPCGADLVAIPVPARWIARPRTA